MSARKVSFRISGETASRMERLTCHGPWGARDVASDALDFYVQLSADDHEAIRHIERFGAVDDTRLLAERISRVVQETWYEIALRRVRSNTLDGEGETLETEDELLAITSRAAKRPQPVIR